jgi:hypothetical protein
MSTDPTGVEIHGTRARRVTYYGRGERRQPMTDEQQAAKIRALLEERAGYEARGDMERAAQVDASLSHLGHRAAKPVDRAEKRPAADKDAATR